MPTSLLDGTPVGIIPSCTLPNVPVAPESMSADLLHSAFTSSRPHCIQRSVREAGTLLPVFCTAFIHAALHFAPLAKVAALALMAFSGQPQLLLDALIFHVGIQTFATGLWLRVS